MSKLTNYRSLALLAATTLVVAACGGGGKGAYTPPPQPQNTAPAVTAIADVSADQDTTVGPIQIGIADAQSEATALVVTVKADGTSLFPEDGVVLAGTGAARTLTLTPLEAVTGAATITLTAADPQGLVTTRSFKVTVNAKNASAWAAMQATVQKAEVDAATQVNGFTYQQDVEDPTLLGSLLPPPGPVEGIE